MKHLERPDAPGKRIPRCRRLPGLCAAVVLAAGVSTAQTASAHFQELIPSQDIVTPETGTGVSFDIRFTHPMENGPVMEMARPTRFGVMVDGKVVDLDKLLAARTVDGASAFTAEYAIKAPGDYLFFVEPAPYWEPAEGVMIVHYAKVVVDAFGAEEGWDAEIGLPVEIAPLTRPYGLWTGNAFRGIVKKDGQPAPFATVEVEYRSEGKIQVPEGPFVTQVVKADASGVFSYVMPKAGWWGFAALIEGDVPMNNPEGKPVPVELGGLMWVRTQDMPGSGETK